MREKSSHKHKLKKHKYKNGSAVFFCTGADCHYKIEVELALGKECLCNICNCVFILNEISLKLIKPHCNNCGKQRITGEDGKKHYVPKINSRILTTIADETTSNLKERLASVVTMNNPENEADEDI